MFAIIENDLVVGTIDGTVDGIAIPAELESIRLDRLRLKAGIIVDASDLDEFYVDETGIKHVVDGDGRQLIECGFDDVLVKDGDLWRVSTESDQLVQVKVAAVARLTVACAAAIVGGYVSAALGSTHRYPSAITDQINMMGSVTASLLPELPEDWLTPFWCADEAGDWAFRPHSAEAIQQAGADGKQHVQDCQAMLASLTTSVQAAATAAEVDAIEWEAV